MSKIIDIKIKASTQGVGEIKKLEEQLSALGKINSFKKLKRDLEDSKTAWVSAQAEVEKLAKEIAQTHTPTKALTDRFKAAKTEASKLKTQFLKNQDALQALRKTLGQAGVNTRNLNSEQKRLSATVAKTRDELSKAAKINTAMGLLNVRPFKDIQREIAATKKAYITLKESGKLSLEELSKAKLNMKSRIVELKSETAGWSRSIAKARVGLAALAGVGYTMAKSFSGFSEFSQRMAEVNTLLDTSRGRLVALSESILDISTRIPQTASELAAAEYDIISAGVALESSSKVLELSAKAAVAGVTDTKTAVNAGIGVINAYGKDIGDLGNVYNVLFETVKSGVTTFPALSQHIGEVLPTARSAGVRFEEVAASIAAMTKAGIRTPQAATAMKGAITAMAAPTPEAKSAFDELGITWQGLIPTLDAIREKGLEIDQLRLLIPDVEARTGVLALTQNMDGLKQILENMMGPADAMQDAFDKMKDTPENQIKLFKNEISALSIELGGFLSKGVLPVLRGLSSLIESITAADPITKGLVGTLATAGAGFILWKLGLGAIVMGLKGMVNQIGAGIVELNALASSSLAAGAALKAGLGLSFVYTAFQLAKLVKVSYETYGAVQQTKKAQENLFKTTDKIIEKYGEFKDIELPEDITDAAQEDLEGFRRQLLKARAYWIALQQKLQVKAKGTTIFGTATKEALQASSELRKVDTRLSQINSDLRRIKAAGESAGEGLQKPAEAILATNEQLDEFEKQAKKAYEYATEQAKKYADQVIAWEEKIKYARLSTEDKIRELSRKGLSDEEQWADRRLQAEEKLAAAKEALRQDDYKLAEKLAKEAEGLYAGLAEEVKGGADGSGVVVKSIAETKEIAINGVQAVGDFIQELYGEQRDSAQGSRDEWLKTADAIQTELDKIAMDRIANIKIELQGLSQAQSMINSLTKDETKYITVVTRNVTESKEGGPILKASTGAFVRRAGQLGGYGGGDKIKAMLEAGEYIIRKEAVSKYGSSFFAALNAMRLDVPGMVKAKVGGLISNTAAPIPAFATGGLAQGPAETLVVRFQAGDVEAPVKITDGASRTAMKKMARELSRMKMVYGK